MTGLIHFKIIFFLTGLAVLSPDLFCRAMAASAPAADQETGPEGFPLGPTENALLAIAPNFFSTSLKAVDPTLGAVAVNSRVGLGLTIEGRSGGFGYFEFRGLFNLSRVDWSPDSSVSNTESLYVFAIQLGPVFRPFKDRRLSISLNGGLVQEPLLKPISANQLLLEPVVLPLVELLVAWYPFTGAARLGLELGAEYLLPGNASFTVYQNGLGLSAKLPLRLTTSFGEIFLTPALRLRTSKTAIFICNRESFGGELGFAFTL